MTRTSVNTNGTEEENDKTAEMLQPELNDKTQEGNLNGSGIVSNLLWYL